MANDRATVSAMSTAASDDTLKPDLATDNSWTHNVKVHVNGELRASDREPFAALFPAHRWVASS